MMKRLTILMFIITAAVNTAVCPATGFSQETADRLLFEHRIRTEPISPDLLWEAIQRLDIQGDSLVFGQALLETGRFTSYLFLNGNNLFGMKQPAVRETLAVGKLFSYATYNNWYDSLVDYKLFQEYYISHGYDLSNYAKFLKDLGYAEDKAYHVLIHKLIEEIPNDRTDKENSQEQYLLADNDMRLGVSVYSPGCLHNLFFNYKID